MSKNTHSPAKQDHKKEDVSLWSKEELQKKCLKQQEYIKQLEQKHTAGKFVGYSCNTTAPTL